MLYIWRKWLVGDECWLLIFSEATLQNLNVNRYEISPFYPLTVNSLMCFNDFLYIIVCYYLYLLLKSFIRTFIKTGRLNIPTTKQLQIFIFSDSLIKKVLFLIREFCTELFCNNFILISTFYKLIHKVTHSGGLFLNSVRFSSMKL